MKKMTNVALCYDFDGTLAVGNMQEYGFMSFGKPPMPWQRNIPWTKCCAI